jgi:tRNA 2-thiouridine synthesizing protein A
MFIKNLSVLLPAIDLGQVAIATSDCNRPLEQLLTGMQSINQQGKTYNMSEYTEKFDATGLNCPLPILRSKKVLTKMNSGEVLYVISTDSGSVKDFDAFCKQTGHSLLESSEADGKYHYYIKKS